MIGTKLPRNCDLRANPLHSPAEMTLSPFLPPGVPPNACAGLAGSEGAWQWLGVRLPTQALGEGWDSRGLEEEDSPVSCLQLEHVGLLAVVRGFCG